MPAGRGCDLAQRPDTAKSTARILAVIGPPMSLRFEVQEETFSPDCTSITPATTLICCAQEARSAHTVGAAIRRTWKLSQTSRMSIERTRFEAARSLKPIAHKVMCTTRPTPAGSNAGVDVSVTASSAIALRSGVDCTEFSGHNHLRISSQRGIAHGSRS